MKIVVDFDTIDTNNEVEALLTENRLIKDIQPKFNARLLDDKTFPYLMISTDEEYPGVYVTREPRTKNVKLYGPFTSVWQLKEAVSHGGYFPPGFETYPDLLEKSGYGVGLTGKGWGPGRIPANSAARARLHPERDPAPWATLDTSVKPTACIAA
jgi:hypothetical protein